MNKHFIVCLCYCVIILINWTPPHLCACPKTGNGFPTQYVVVFVFVFNGLRWEGVVYFVDISGLLQLTLTRLFKLSFHKSLIYQIPHPFLHYIPHLKAIWQNTADGDRI